MGTCSLERKSQVSPACKPFFPVPFLFFSDLIVTVVRDINQVQADQKLINKVSEINEPDIIEVVEVGGNLTHLAQNC